MDPNACLHRILDAAAADDADAFEEGFDALAEWLQRGGFPPRAATMRGWSRANHGNEFLRGPQRFAIFTAEPGNPEGGWIFTEYTLKGREINRFRLQD